MTDMTGPIVVGAVFAIAFSLWSWLRPNGARLFLGLFFIAMGLGVNLGYYLLNDPSGFASYPAGSPWVVYRWLATVIEQAPVAFGVLLVIFEVGIGLLMLSSGKRVKVGVAGSMLFVLALIPASWVQLVWAGMLVGQTLLLRCDFDRSLVAMVRERLAARRVEVA